MHEHRAIWPVGLDWVGAREKRNSRREKRKSRCQVVDRFFWVWSFSSLASVLPDGPWWPDMPLPSWAKFYMLVYIGLGQFMVMDVHILLCNLQRDATVLPGLGLPGSCWFFTGVLHGEKLLGTKSFTEVVGVGGPRRDHAAPPRKNGFACTWPGRRGRRLLVVPFFFLFFTNL